MKTVLFIAIITQVGKKVHQNKVEKRNKAKTMRRKAFRNNSMSVNTIYHSMSKHFTLKSYLCHEIKCSKTVHVFIPKHFNYLFFFACSDNLFFLN